MRFSLWLVGIALLGGSWLRLQAGEPENEARTAALKLAQVLVEKMDIQDTSAFPGVVAWRRDFAEAAKNPDTLDADKLVTHNPHWWVAYFEIAPGDPAMMLLHCEVVLAGGEAQRAQQLAAIYFQRPGNPGIYRQGLLSTMREANQAQKAANELTKDGTALHDGGDYDGAIAKYDEALKKWPANGWTAYERGFSTYVRALVKAGKPVPKNGTLTLNDKTLEDLPERETIEACYAQARLHDPMQVVAYQGRNENWKPLQALLGKAMPVWQRMRADVSTSIDDEDLAQLTDGFHEAGLHEYALAARDVMVARRRKFAPEDHPILSEHLRALAANAAIEHTIGMLAGEAMHAAVLVAPEQGYEMLVKPPPKE
jgi:tetratricopeptide (TPR) repeat protein